jgi:hypothetical protein
MTLKQLYLKIYRFLGFAGLISMTSMLFYYGITMIFFLFNASWIAPTVLSVTSDKMLQFSSAYQSAVQTNSTLRIGEEQATRDVDAAKVGLAALKQLRSEALKHSQDLKGLSKTKGLDIASSEALAADMAAVRSKIEESLAAKLITQHDATLQFSAIQQFRTNLTDNKIVAGTAKLSDAQQLVALNAQIVAAENEVATKTAMAEALKTNLVLSNAALETLKKAPYYAALASPESTNLAFIPYENLSVAKPGAPIFNCYLMMIGCYKVGTVEHVYMDEQVVDFPLFNVRFSHTMRGVLVKIKVDDPREMSDQLFFVGRKPLFL